MILKIQILITTYWASIQNILIRSAKLKRSYIRGAIKGEEKEKEERERERDKECTCIFIWEGLSEL